MEFSEIYDKLDKVFNDIEQFYMERGMANDDDAVVQNAIDEALNIISEKYGVIFHKNGFTWDYEDKEE